tara:strand:- start:898 stop:1629 length:732 start_codon:yes stop_codon:yes gene_type:complete
MKRIFDIIFALVGLILTCPLQLFFLFLVWEKDKSNPFYIAKRVGINGNIFNMIKIRTMIVNADLSGVDSTSDNDPRITRIGSLIRRYKIDELPQLLNILIGDMSFVGPRPSVKRDTDLYTKLELKLLSIKPGLTDFASIVFSDESKILADSNDPDLSYHQLIRPDKSRLGLFYVENNNIFMDIQIILITIFSLISRRRSLRLSCLLLSFFGASKNLVDIASRRYSLVPKSPPGSDMITKSRKI